MNVHFRLDPGDIYCGEIFDNIARHSSTKVAPVGTSASMDTCLIFDETAFKSGQVLDSPDILNFCGVSEITFHSIQFLLHFISKNNRSGS